MRSPPRLPKVPVREGSPASSPTNFRGFWPPWRRLRWRSGRSGGSDDDARPAPRTSTRTGPPATMARNRLPVGRLVLLGIALVVATPLTAPASQVRGCLGPATRRLSPPPAPPGPPPVASFDFQPHYPIPFWYTFFDGRSSTDPDGNITSYSWEFGDGTNYTSSDGWAGHSFASLGTFTVNLTVQDDTGLTNITGHNVTVTRPPVATFTMSPDPVYIRQIVTFDASASNDSMRSIISYHWAFGDSTFADGMIVTHVYTYPGDAGVDLLINDDGGFGAEGFRIITVGYDVGPPVSSAAIVGIRGENGWFRSAVTATLRATDEGSGIFASFGTTTWPTLDLPGGSHSVRLRAVDAAGNVAERSTTFQVGPERPASLAGPLLFSGVAAASLGSVAFALYRTRNSKRRSPEETRSQEPKNDGT